MKSGDALGSSTFSPGAGFKVVQVLQTVFLDMGLLVLLRFRGELIDSRPAISKWTGLW